MPGTEAPRQPAQALWGRGFQPRHKRPARTSALRSRRFSRESSTLPRFFGSNASTLGPFFPAAPPRRTFVCPFFAGSAKDAGTDHPSIAAERNASQVIKNNQKSVCAIRQFFEPRQRAIFSAPYWGFLSSATGTNGAASGSPGPAPNAGNALNPQPLRVRFRCFCRRTAA